MRSNPAHTHGELDIDPLMDADKFGTEQARRGLLDAIDLASDQDQMTWLTDSGGKRIAAIVPVDMAETAERFGEPEWVTERKRAAEQFRAGKRPACGGTNPHDDHTFNQGTHCPGWPE